MSAKHTPTPWRICTNAQFSSEVETADGSLSIALAHAKGHDLLPDAYEAPEDDVSDANAAFIVRACNAHDDLVAALEAVDKHLKAYGTDTIGPETAKVWDQVRSALVKSDGDV
jgi:hypothetical protein